VAESRRITWDDTEIALLITGGEDGDYIVPAIVLDDEGRVMEGREVLEAIGVPVGLPDGRRAQQ
jgi:hypothetical protein